MIFNRFIFKIMKMKDQNFLVLLSIKSLKTNLTLSHVRDIDCAKNWQNNGMKFKITTYAMFVRVISAKYTYVFIPFALCFLMYFELIWVDWKLFLWVWHVEETSWINH